jgi:peptidyl-prolyl cis-trans isomerase C
MPVIINDVEISDEQVFAEMQYHPASSEQEAQSMAATALAIRELLLQEAARLDISPPDGSAEAEVREDFIISRLLEQEVSTPEPDDVSCQRYYDQNIKTFRDTEGNVVLFEYAKPAIAAYLKEASWQMAVKQYLKILAGKAVIATDVGRGMAGGF